MNTTNNVEVSTLFFHENNTAAMNIAYDIPLATMEPVEQIDLTKTPNRFVNRFTNTRASQKTSQKADAEDPAENTIIHMMQTSVSYTAYNKQFSEECACGIKCTFTSHSQECKTLARNVRKLLQKMEKSKENIKEAFMQHVRPINLSEGVTSEGTAGLVRSAPTEDTNPVPWRWENRTAVPVEMRGACLFYRPMRLSTFHGQHKTPICFLHENDVIDNGTVMCLRAHGNECFYGNETIKAILEFDTSKCTQSTYKNMCDDAMKWSFLFAIIAILFSFVAMVTHIKKHLVDSYEKGYTVRSVFRTAFYTVSTIALWEFFLDYGLFPSLSFLDKGLVYALCVKT